MTRERPRRGLPGCVPNGRGEKPYRLYRGGRRKGKVPLDAATRRPAASPTVEPRGRAPVWLWAALALLGVVLLAILFLAALGYLSFSRGVEEANDRLPRGAAARLAKSDRSFLSDPATILVVAKQEL